MRLFFALDIDREIRERIAHFMEAVCGFAPDARWVRPETLHVTLKFIGEMPDAELAKIKTGAREIRIPQIEIRFQGHGFFPTAKSARVFWIGIEAGPELGQLAAAIDSAMTRFGVSKDQHGFSPHLTLARASGRSGDPQRRRGDRPNRVFDILQKQLEVLPTPDFGTLTARTYFLYQSQLSPKGSKYTKLERFELGRPGILPPTGNT